MNHASHSFSSQSRTNFLTLYFPIQKCTAGIKAQISTKVGEFINAAEPAGGNPEGLRFVARGWIKETKIVEGEVAQGFMFCLMWTDKKSEKRYKSENEHWRVLMQYLKGMGMLSEDQFHGKGYKVLGEGQRERFEFSDDSSDDVVEMDEELESIRQRLEELAAREKEVELAKDSSCLGHGQEHPDVTKVCSLSDTPSIPQNAKSVTREGSCVTAWWDEEPQRTVEDDSDDESDPSTPILTPSSSTMSLNSLFEDTKPLIELPGTWKSEYDISRPEAPEVNILAIPPLLPLVGDTPAPLSLQVCKPRRASFASSISSSNALRETADHREAGLETQSDSNSNEPPTFDPAVIEQLRDGLSNIPCTVSTAADDSSLGRYGIPKWNADVELQNAKSRFWRRRNRFAAPRLETQGATLRGRSPPPLPPRRSLSAEQDLTIDPLRSVGPDEKDNRRNPWWAYLRECLPSPAASKAGSDVEAALELDLILDQERAVDDKVASSG